MISNGGDSAADVERLKNHIRRRLEKVCQGWSAEDKEALVTRITLNELRFPSGRLMSDIVIEKDADRLGIHEPSSRR